MPQIGWFEILVIVLLSILIIGPKDFPVVLRKIGKWTNSIKKYFNDIQRNVTDVQDSIEDEISVEKNILNFELYFESEYKTYHLGQGLGSGAGIDYYNSFFINE